MSAVEGLADRIAAGAPAVSEGAAAAQESAASAAAPKHRELRDRYGNPFDPSIHQAQPDGTPKLWRAGRLQGIPGRQLPRPGRSRVGVGEPRQSSPPPLGQGVAGPGAAPGAQSSDSAIYVAQAAVVVDSVTHGAAAIFQDDVWKPRREKIGGVTFDERANLVETLARYFEAKGIRDVPPGWMLLAAIGSYVAPRLAAPKTRSRLGQVAARIAAALRRVRGARPDPGHHAQREDDAREAAGRAA